MPNHDQIVRGMLRPDGTLELAERLDLPAGPVEVTVRPLLIPVPSPGWFEVLEQIRAEHEASGGTFREQNEIDAEIEDLRDGDDDRIDVLHRQVEANRLPGHLESC